MIDVTGDVRPRTAINRPLLIDAKKVFAVTAFGYLVEDERPYIFNNALVFGNWPGCE
jgi:hypothetical protein